MGDVVKKSKGGRFIGWYIRYRDTDGRRKQRASHQPSKAEARRYLLEVEARVAREQVGIPKPVPALTVAELVERFLAEYASPRIKDLDRYRRAGRYALRPVLEVLGRVPVTQLSRPTLERLRDSLSRRYEANTVRFHLRPLGAALSWAVRQGLLPYSPLAGMERPRAEHSIEYLSREDAAKLLSDSERRARESARPADWCCLIGLALGLYAGLRRGEIFGLRWQDIDLDAGRLTVARSYKLLPKSNKPRYLPLPVVLIPLLREWRPHCPETADRLICPVFNRGRWGMSTISPKGKHSLQELFRASGCPIPARPWHALRHTYASHYVMAGGNIMVLRQLLGHSSVETTQIYAHLAPDYLTAEANRVRY
jgi:integrase